MDWILIIAVSSSIWVADEVLKRLGVYGQTQRQDSTSSEHLHSSSSVKSA